MPGSVVAPIPTIDLGAYFEGSPADRRRVASEANRACEEIGFFQISRHGVAAETVRRTYDTARDFFALPVEQKLRIRQPAPSVSRGYTHSKAKRCLPVWGKWRRQT